MLEAERDVPVGRLASCFGTATARRRNGSPRRMDVQAAPGWGWSRRRKAGRLRSRQAVVAMLFDKTARLWCVTTLAVGRLIIRANRATARVWNGWPANATRSATIAGARPPA